MEHFRDALAANQRGDTRAALASLDQALEHVDGTWDDGQSGYVVGSLKALLLRSSGDYRGAMECVRTFNSQVPESRFRYYQGM